MAACRQRLRTMAAAEWKQYWAQNPHGSHLRKIIDAPHKKLLEFHRRLRRAASSVIIQLQTGKVALAAYLGTFATDSVECPCGRGFRTRSIFSLHAPHMKTSAGGLSGMSPGRRTTEGY